MPTNELSHLTEEQIEELMARYYGGENIPKLVQQYGLSCAPNGLCKTFPPKKVGSCLVCGSTIYQPRPSRTQGRMRVDPAIRCERCGHLEGRECHCNACREARDRAIRLEALREKEKVAAFCHGRWSYDRYEVGAGELPLKTAVALVALVRSGGWDKDENVFPWGTSGAPFAPLADEYRSHLVKHLVAADLVAPSPESAPEAFPYLSTGERGWHPELVEWVILHPSPSQLVRDVIDTADSQEWPEAWIQDAPDLWRSLAAAECWEFCELSMQKRGLPMPGKVALRELIGGLLKHFSVSRCYRIIWTGAARAPDAMAQRSLNRQHAANYMIGVCQRTADRARAESWELKGFGRNHDLPRSEMSYVLHDVFLKHGEAGFNACPAMLTPKPLRSDTEAARMSEETNSDDPIARIRALATEIFRDPDKAERWLKTRNRVLDDAPINLLETSDGVEMIETVLRRIEHGVFS